MFDGGFEGLAEVGFEAAAVFVGEGVGMDELLGEAGGAEFEGFEEEGFFVGGDDEFGGAAADVDDEGGAGAVGVGGEVDGLADGEVDEVGFLVGGDDLDAEAEAGFGGADEVAAVDGFADGGGGVSQDDIAVEAVGDALVAGEDVEGVVDGAGGEAVMDEGGGAEVGEVFVGGEGFEGEGVGDFDDDHVEGVGADVDGGDAEVSWGEGERGGLRGGGGGGLGGTRRRERGGAGWGFVGERSSVASRAWGHYECGMGECLCGM